MTTVTIVIMDDFLTALDHLSTTLRVRLELDRDLSSFSTAFDKFTEKAAATRSAFERLAKTIDISMRDLPLWGWWAEFNPHRRYHWQLQLIVAPRPHRAQARACAKNVRRWKRRRFIQSLKARV